GARRPRPRAPRRRRLGGEERRRRRRAVPRGDGAPGPAAERAPQAGGLRAPRRGGAPDLERCYQRALREDPALGRAKVTVTIAVAPSGRVTSVVVEPPPASGTLVACLREAVARWPFPPAPAAYETAVPLTLSGK
ncbi:MAG TPA: AgmX/PglI C-terminal domain-containing protein, partial [Polyangia bacterium]|nr:AgmX/PglI C-terminal domain-containing protein [Polyangia bacterium]